VRGHPSTVDRAARLLATEILRLPAPEPTSPLITFDDAELASARLDAEPANLLAAIRYAAQNGPRGCAWLLADGLRGYFLASMHGDAGRYAEASTWANPPSRWPAPWTTGVARRTRC
jgi:hypothetical protein